MEGHCEVLSLRSHDRAPYGAFVMLERRAVKVACVVLRGLGEGDLAWLPGALKAMTRYTVLADIAGQVARTTNTPRVTTWKVIGYLEDIL